jgi:hypothetical protein
VEVDPLRDYRATRSRASTLEEAARDVDLARGRAIIAALESGGELSAASTTAELARGAVRTVEDDLVLAVVVHVDKVCLPTAGARI